MSSLSDLSRQMSAHSLSESSRPSTSQSTASDIQTFNIRSPISKRTYIEENTCSSSIMAFDDFFAVDAKPPAWQVQDLLPAHNTYYTSKIRRSRQNAIRAQCSSSHLTQISALVARMVQQEDQCSICSKSETSSIHTTSSEETEHDCLNGIEIDVEGIRENMAWEHEQSLTDTCRRTAEDLMIDTTGLRCGQLGALRRKHRGAAVANGKIKKRTLA